MVSKRGSHFDIDPHCYRTLVIYNQPTRLSVDGDGASWLVVGVREEGEQNAFGMKIFPSPIQSQWMTELIGSLTRQLNPDFQWTSIG